MLNLIGMAIQQYPGRSLLGMGPKKLIVNASFVFDEFETILKEEHNHN